MPTNKSNKQKCLEMWEWLAENPTQDKQDYFTYLKAQNRTDEWALCWACVEALDKTISLTPAPSMCSICPISWPSGDCLAKSSPYTTWAHHFSPEASQKAAQEIVQLIKTTWKEEKE